MKSAFYVKTTRLILLMICVCVCNSSLSQRSNRPNKYYQSVINAHSLGSVLPIDNIKSITVNNYRGQHTLTTSQLSTLKKQLKEAKFAGGLLVKPGHITLSIAFEINTKANAGYVYAYQGMINFDGAIDKAGNHFSGTYYLPLSVNFDNYK